MTDAVVRQATHHDYDAVAAFTQDTWTDQGRGDYIPDVFHDWIDANGPEWRTVVVEVDGDVAGICQGKFLSDYEAWLEGMRVHPEHRGEGHGLRMVRDLFEWASDGGATVARNMVFGWNDAGLGQSIAAGFEPRTSFRWAEPEPRSTGPEADVVDDTAAAWSYWARSDARDVLGGLALDSEHAWALSELSRERLHALADDERVFAVQDGGTRGMAARVRTTGRPTDEDDTETLAEYAVGAWADVTAATRLFDAIRTDAHDLGADASRVLIPESPRHVAKAAAARVGISEHCDFVLEADLT